MRYERKFFTLILAFILCATALFGCNKAGGKGYRAPFDGFSAHILDVGEGDAIFIRFPDGKNMLIDTGDKFDGVSEYIIDFLKDYNVETLDFLIITHPDSDHSGNALDIVNAFSIGTVYVPYILGDLLELYPTYQNFYQAVTSQEIEMQISDCYKVITGDGYGVVFLSPYPSSFSYGSYAEFNSVFSPTAEQSNALSPVIYVEVNRVRMVFTGDAPKAQEIIAMQNATVNLSHYAYYGINVDLSGVDLLKVSHHGADDGSCEEFLSLLKPKNAVISVGANNIYGHPTRSVLERLELANPEYLLYRTDVAGTVSALVDKDGVLNIVTDA